ncbi:CBL-interacting serine/threonine-protein kinase 14-like [Phoenix dactylifera]|uniref:non-specific serine/threonine protein kinase n=1 Tax=Phoenix dactylifera TaxID=42345 RepID=A0A8B7CXL9_PHODC|nr:CBL-interacting serine/threonine-protein kinase 14-like [Phoenix dactylifera]
MQDSGGWEAPRRAAKVLFGRYELVGLLGFGASARVYLARDLRSGQSVALKAIPKGRVAKGGRAPNVVREISIMRHLRHPHVLRLLAVLASRSKIYIVLELARGGELLARVARGRLPEDLSRRYFRQLISAIGYCHSRGVFHRDLKPENLLLDDAGDLKVSDFGLSALPDQIRGDGLLHTVCGTPAYVAPEILSKKGYDGAKIDVWSCGVILYVLNAGYLPFNDPNLMAMYRKIYRGEYRCPEWTSPELRQLIGRILDPNPETRITVDSILHDPWFKKGLSEEERAAAAKFHAAETAEAEDGKFWMSEEPDRALDAFDLISFSSGLDLSGLFGPASDRQRFVSAEPAEVILGRAEDIGAKEGLVVRRKGEKGLGAVEVEGQIGNLVARMVVRRLAEGLVVVEVEGGGDAERGFLQGKLLPALKGPVKATANSGSAAGRPYPVL